MFDQLKKAPTVRQMPFTVELREGTKFMTLDSWIEIHLKKRKERLATHPNWSKEKLEGYEQGLIDLALDAKIEIKRLEGKL